MRNAIKALSKKQIFGDVMETAKLVLGYGLMGIALAPIVIGIGWGIWETEIAPRLIPQAEIDKLADEIAARDADDPEHAAFIEEHSAWVRSEGVQQGKWRRVRRALKRRAQSQEV
jgi:hypothetical protein